MSNTSTNATLPTTTTSLVVQGENSSCGQVQAESYHMTRLLEWSLPSNLLRQIERADQRHVEFKSYRNAVQVFTFELSDMLDHNDPLALIQASCLSLLPLQGIGRDAMLRWIRGEWLNQDEEQQLSSASLAWQRALDVQGVDKNISDRMLTLPVEGPMSIDQQIICASIVVNHEIEFEDCSRYQLVQQRYPNMSNAVLRSLAILATYAR